MAQPHKYAPQQTLQYSLFIKRGILEALQGAFEDHPDRTVARCKVALDFTHDRWSLPGVIIKYYERELTNAGVGHMEYLVAPTDPNPQAPTEFVLYYHRIYRGDIGFDIYGQSSVDRDLVRDALVEVLSMFDATPAGNAFLTRFYNSLHSTPYGLWHFPVLNLDKITGYGETAGPAPWRPEDTLVYQVSYRVPIFGEFYSNTPTTVGTTGVLQEVDVYPYIKDVDSPPDETDADDFYRFAGWPDDTKII